MAESSVLKVSFGGDAAGLQAAAAVAKAQLSAVNAELKNLAKQAAASGGANDNLTKQMREVAASAAKAKAEFASLSKGLNDNKGHFAAHGEQVGVNRMQMMEFAHISRSVFDELAAGGSPMRALAMEGGRIAQALGAGPGGVTGTLQALAGIALRNLPLIGAAAAAAGVAMAVLADSERDAAEAQKRFTADLASSGNFSAFKGEVIGVAHAFEEWRGSLVGRFRDSIKDMARDFVPVTESMTLSKEEANALLDELAKFPSVNNQIVDSFGSIAKQIRGLSGGDALAAFTKSLESAGKEPQKYLEAAVKGFADLSAGGREFAKEAIASGDAARQQAAALRLVLELQQRSVAENAASISQSRARSSAEKDRIQQLVQVARATGDYSGLLRDLSHISDSERNANVALIASLEKIKNTLDATTNSAGAWGAALERAIQQVGSSGVRIRELTDKLTQLQNAMRGAGGGSAAALEAEAELKDQINAAKEAQTGLTAETRSEEKSVLATLAGHRDDVKTQQELVSQLKEKLRNTNSEAEENKAALEVLRAQLELQNRINAAKRSELELAAARVPKDDAEGQRKAKIALADFDLKHAGDDVAARNAALAEKASAQNSGATEKAKKDVENYVLSLQKAAETAKAEVDAWGKGNVERQKAVALAGAEAAARKEGRALTQTEIADVERLATEQAKANDKVAEMNKTLQEVNSAISSFASSLESALDNAVIKGEKLNQVFKNLAQTLASSALKSVLSGVLTGQGLFGNIFGTAAPAGSNQLGGLFGALGGGLTSLIPGGGLFSGLLSLLPKFDEGTNLVPRDMLAVIHKNEAVVPAAQNPAATGNPFSMGHTINAAPTIHIHNSGGPLDTREVSKAVMKEIRRGAFLGLA